MTVTKELREYKELPYTVVGTTHLPEEYALVLTGKGLRKLASLITDEDDVRITITNNNFTKFEILPNDEKKPKEPPKTEKRRKNHDI